MTKKLRLKDDNGEWVYAGDLIEFTYGIPPVAVITMVRERDGTLWIEPGRERHKLRSLRGSVGNWYKSHIFR